jgi:ADP-heptose:LPS heptosyltransferase
VICTFPEDRFVLWSLGAGAKQRVGQKQQRMGWMLNVRPDIHKEIGGVLNYYCDLAEAAGGKVDSSETEYRVPDSGREWADRFLTTHNLKGKPRLVVLHPGASAPHRMWPPDRCAAVIEILRSDGRTAVVLCGSEADSTVVGEVKRHLRTEIPVAEPGGSIPNFAGLLQACMLCICNDSGPRHLAAAVGTASLAFAPRFNAPAWKIYADDLRSGTMEGRDECPACPPGECRNILPKGAEFGSICLRMIGVEEAAARARAVLEALSASPRGRTQ